MRLDAPLNVETVAVGAKFHCFLSQIITSSYSCYIYYMLYNMLYYMYYILSAGSAGHLLPGVQRCDLCEHLQ